MTAWAPGALTPRPGAAPFGRMLAAQTRAELTLLLRNGEQVLLTLIIPLGLLVALSKASFVTVPGGDDRVGFFVPGVMALAVMSSAFTGQAIGVGFERQYGVLKRLGATSLPREVLLGAKTLAVLVVEALQLSLIAVVGRFLGWHPHGSLLSVLVVVALGTAAFSGLGLLLGGTLRGLTALAVANLLWFVLVGLGGVVFPLSHFGGTEQVVRLLPTAALSDGLRQVLQHGATVPLRDLLALTAWAVVSLAATVRWFRWE